MAAILIQYLCPFTLLVYESKTKWSAVGPCTTLVHRPHEYTSIASSRVTLRSHMCERGLHVNVTITEMLKSLSWRLCDSRLPRYSLCWPLHSSLYSGRIISSCSVIIGRLAPPSGLMGILVLYILPLSPAYTFSARTL